MWSRRLAIALAIFVTFLWSTSWILIKVGLQSEELEPLSFAGLRYALAALPAGALLGVAIALVGMLATAFGAQMGRTLARDVMDRFGGAVALTGVTMAIGTAVLLGAGVALEGTTPCVA
ncbi:MAG: hypothetical protein H0V12_04755 [Chloroflexi bacterium]|nr:hypothetical protein [Chloroflexota bacterium]